MSSLGTEPVLINEKSLDSKCQEAISSSAGVPKTRLGTL